MSEAVVRNPSTPSGPSTPPGRSTSPGRLGRGLAKLAIAMAVHCAATALLAGPAYRIGWLALGSGLQAIRWAASGAAAGAVVAVIALALLAQMPASRRLLLATAAALLLDAVVAIPPLLLYQAVQSLPRIHDVTTDTVDPPRFVAVVPLRKAARNPVGYDPATADRQRGGYPDLVPLHLDLPPAEAFARAERAARSMGWDIVAVVPQDLRLEATDTTLLFGFKDDVVIRVRPQGSGSVVDVRSLSRVGGSDFGVNAKRVRRYLDRLAER